MPNVRMIYLRMSVQVADGRLRHTKAAEPSQYRHTLRTAHDLDHEIATRRPYNLVR
jgi:hypothetical protein